MQQVSNEQLELVTVVWQKVIGPIRNLVWQGKSIPRPTEVGNSAKIQHEAFEAARSATLNRVSFPLNSYWFPPRANLCKLYFDAGISMELSSTGLGLVVRDSSGNFLLGSKGNNYTKLHGSL